MEEIRDSYLRFFAKGYISKEQFFEFGLEEIIYIPHEKVQIEWSSLKRRIENNEMVYIRGFGRDAAGTHLFQELYKNILQNENIIKDPTNNAYPTKLIRELTGYSKQKSSKYQLIRNYQISHIFGRTKNVYAFSAPWNIVYLPKILDPFTGHEAKGKMIEEFTNLFQKYSYAHFSPFIEEFNEIITASKFTDKLEYYFSVIKRQGDYDINVIEKLQKAVINEFKPIQITK